MSTETPVTPNSDAASRPAGAAATVPKAIVNAQTVCNQKNEKGKLCNGHLKQLRTGGEDAEVHLRGDDVLFKCQSCGTLYMGPPLGHVRDPKKQNRFVEKELTALLQAAGGTLPAFKKSPTGAWVPALEAEPHAPAAAAKPAPAAKPATAKPAAPATTAAKPAPAAASSSTVIPPNETREEKIARLARVVAEAKARAGKIAPEEIEATAAAAAQRTKPAAASTSGTDSSPTADAHRPAAEAQAATGQASAAPLSPAAATASPVAGAETPDELAPDTMSETVTPAAPPTRAAVATSATGKGIPPPPPHLAPPPGETHAEKIARLKLVVEEAKARAGK